MEQLIIGLGTGRCGTVSLYRLLNKQKHSKFFHESKPMLPWIFDQQSIDNKLKSFKNIKRKYVGEVALYYLPYVEYILKEVPNTKFVCLKRDKEEVVESFLRKTIGRNHWSGNKSLEIEKYDYWDYSFPTYVGISKSEAIRRYWDEYYKESILLERRYKNNFLIVDISELNQFRGVKKILNFIGVSPDQQKVYSNIRENKTNDKHFNLKYLIWNADKTRSKFVNINNLFKVIIKLMPKSLRYK